MGLGDEAPMDGGSGNGAVRISLADDRSPSHSPEVRIPEKRRVSVLLPYRALTERDFCPEHSWDHTSDSIALLVASRLGLPLIKPRMSMG